MSWIIFFEPMPGEDCGLKVLSTVHNPWAMSLNSCLRCTLPMKMTQLIGDRRWS